MIVSTLYICTHWDIQVDMNWCCGWKTVIILTVRMNYVLIWKSTIGLGSNSILGGPIVIYSAIAVIYAACMNINKVSRVKYWGGGALGPPGPPSSYACEYC